MGQEDKAEEETKMDEDNNDEMEIMEMEKSKDCLLDPGVNEA